MSSSRFCNLLYVGRPVPEKGLSDLFQALAAMADLPWRLTVVGDLVSFTAPSEAIRDRVLLLGRVKHAEIAAIMQRHDVLIVPSRYETFGNVALEGLAVGMVVVAARVGGLKKLIANGRTGFHFEAGNARNLEQTLRSVIANLEILDDVRRRARLEAEKYSWPSVVAATHRLLVSLA